MKLFPGNAEIQRRRYDGDYTYKGKGLPVSPRLAIRPWGRKFQLSLKLKYMDNYADFIQELPEGIKEQCKRTAAVTAVSGVQQRNTCKFRLHWTIDGAGSYRLFHSGVLISTAMEIEDVPYYARLLALGMGWRRYESKARAGNAVRLIHGGLCGA